MDALNRQDGTDFDANTHTVKNDMYANTVGPLLWTRDTVYSEKTHDVKGTSTHPKIPALSNASTARYLLTEYNLENRGWRSAKDARLEMAASGGVLTDLDYLKTINKDHPHRNWFLYDLGMKTSAGKFHLRLGKTIAFFLKRT